MEIERGVSPNKRQLISVCLELCDNCKVGCPYCLLEEKVEEMSKEQMLNIVCALETYGVTRFTIGGGEPLDVPYVYEIGNVIKSHGHTTLLRTSACKLMNYEIISNCFDLVDVSIDSHKKEIMEVCKPHINSEIVFENIVNLSKFRIDFRCNILITRYNYDDILPTVSWLASNGVKKIRIQKLVSRGKAKRIFTDINVSDDEYNHVLHKIFILASKLNINVSEVKSVNSQTLCIVKPNGELYVGTPVGILKMGSVFDNNSLNQASKLVQNNQKKLYGVSYDGLKQN